MKIFIRSTCCGIFWADTFGNSNLKVYMLCLTSYWLFMLHLSKSEQPNSDSFILVWVIYFYRTETIWKRSTFVKRSLKSISTVTNNSEYNSNEWKIFIPKKVPAKWDGFQFRRERSVRWNTQLCTHYTHSMSSVRRLIIYRVTQLSITLLSCHWKRALLSLIDSQLVSSDSINFEIDILQQLKVTKVSAFRVVFEISINNMKNLFVELQRYVTTFLSLILPPNHSTM